MHICTLSFLVFHVVSNLFKCFRYNATIEAIIPNGYLVSYDEWGNTEEACISGPGYVKELFFLLFLLLNSFCSIFKVDPANVKPIHEKVIDALLDAEKEAEATRQAIKRKIAQAAVADFQSRNLPAKLRIEPNDPEDVVWCHFSSI